MNAGRQRREDLRVGQRNPVARARGGVEVEADALSLFKRNWTLGQAADRSFGPCRSARTAMGRPVSCSIARTMS